MKKTVFISSIFLVALTIPARAQSVFPDVQDNHWAAAAVAKLAAAGIIEGRPASMKRAASTRAQAKSPNQAQAPKIAAARSGAKTARETEATKTVARKMPRRASQKLKTDN